MRIFLTGISGHIGSRLYQALRASGYTVTGLTRNPDALRNRGFDCELVSGDATQPGSWLDHISAYGGIIHLAGEGLFAKRWTTAYKNAIRASRIQSTALIAEALAKAPNPASRLWISGSAIGYYGPHGSEELRESDSPGQDPMAQLCADWEQATSPARQAGVRVVNLRIGVVLSVGVGALGKLVPLFKGFVGGPVGSGRQYVSWIHEQDLLSMILWSLETPSVQGPLNATAPHPVTNKELAQALGRQFRRPSFFWTPGFVLRLVVGEAAAMLLTGQRVLPEKALSLGFRFAYPEIQPALAQLFGSAQSA